MLKWYLAKKQLKKEVSWTQRVDRKSSRNIALFSMHVNAAIVFTGVTHSSRRYYEVRFLKYGRRPHNHRKTHHFGFTRNSINNSGTIQGLLDAHRQVYDTGEVWMASYVQVERGM